ncbi:nitrate reductase molybdenum cofactor assembly chaperone [Virgibacillus profundi]|uniref:Nitrate reductase molybdenum cofactor assembly chaperone n=1 Tax=Virgibacillus profundi TaxID=2024555 RepID=A0A2A2IGZ9_9BACI|nr:nitrate reductase molybdenum cofactor assembly chaperone [Virgibacillus profundi]PAV30812.1 nitrate reductase molybdenum cofactor assembly chaperone [Virgibacillus profundi]PXY54995.1 nitrate reductase molybdenum cofactor assembly chaperone [Virgibacillus profundi]
MNQTEDSLVYQMISYLLQYPNQLLIEVLPELQNEIKTVNDQQIQNDLKKFLDKCADMPLESWVDHYIAHFDFGKTTNLYVTYLKLGEQRERGLELLKLKKFYESAGFDVTDKELPDYLPIILEFCANVSYEKSNELLQMHALAIQEIRGKLKESKSHYAYVFDVLVLQMEKNGISFIKKEVQKKKPIPVPPLNSDRESLMNSINWNIRLPKGGSRK